MTAHSLTRIVAEELASVGIGTERGLGAWGAPRLTTWSQTLPGFGIRHYGQGRKVYIVQLYMGGRTRTVTIGNAALFTDAEAVAVARRILLRAQVGENPAAARQRTRSAPRFDDFLSLYWGKIAPTWKPSTRKNSGLYRRKHIDGAFPKMFIDEIDQADVLRWFVGVSDRSGPGAGNACLEIVRALFNKAEAWGVRTENTNPCTGIRMNRRRKCERFLSRAELARLGAVLNARGNAPATRDCHSHLAPDRLSPVRNPHSEMERDQRAAVAVDRQQDRPAHGMDRRGGAGVARRLAPASRPRRSVLGRDARSAALARSSLEPMARRGRAAGRQAPRPSAQLRQSCSQHVRDVADDRQAAWSRQNRIDGALCTP